MGWAPAARLVDAADLPLAAVDGVVRSILIDPGTELQLLRINFLIEFMRVFENEGQLLNLLFKVFGPMLF